jgi:hydroxypyruvate reductase
MIDDRRSLARTSAHDLALDCVEAGIEAATPERVIHGHVSLEGDVLRIADGEYDLTAFEDVVVLGGGKAALGVAAALEAVLGDRLTGGVVVTDDQPADETAPGAVDTGPIDVVVGDHPVPSERGLEGTRQILDHAAAADEGTLVLGVITGGASALLPAPVSGIGLSSLRTVTELLLECGATIDEINAVRKHCSRSKGGQLATTAAPATVAGLVFSDVVGDDLSVIASGPTAPDGSTYADALAVLDRYDVEAPDVRLHLEHGDVGDFPETPAADHPAFDRVENYVLASGRTAIDAAREVARDADYEPLVLSSTVRGEASDAALTHVAIAEEALARADPVEPPAVVLSGGECTVTVEGDGSGGPNQEFALAAAVELPDDAVLASVDTDGVDGFSEVAGAIVDASTGEDRATARDALARNDAGTYLTERGATIRTGPTGTNVNDLHVLVIE